MPNGATITTTAETGPAEVQDAKDLHGGPAHLMTYMTAVHNVRQAVINGTEPDKKDCAIINQVRANSSLLRKQEWETLDQALVSIARDRLIVVGDLRQNGLVRNLGGLGVLVDQYEKVGDMDEADVDMDASTDSTEDKPGFELEGVPIPVIHKGFRVSSRHLEASRRIGSTIDTTGAEIAGRRVRDKLEDIVISGSEKVRIGDNRIFGYTNHPDRNTGTLGGSWPDRTGQQILDDVLDMIADLEDDRFFGPYILYIPTHYAPALRQDFKSESDKTTWQRILELEEIQAIRVVDRMQDDNVVLISLKREVVDLSIGQDVTMIDWTTKGGMMQHFRALAAMAPRLKSDMNESMGLAHYTAA